MLAYYLTHLDELVVQVKHQVALRAAGEVRELLYGRVDAAAAHANDVLFTCLQALSYLRELPQDEENPRVKELVSFLLAHVELQPTSLEPYNLYERATTAQPNFTVLAANEDLLALNTNLLLLGTGTYTKDLTLPLPYDPQPAPLC